MFTTFAQWCQSLALAQTIRNVVWAFPTIEIVHLAGLVVVFGSIFVLNLRMLGFILSDTPAAQVAKGLAPWTLVGLGIQIVTGPLLFVSGAVRFSENGPFRIKIVLIAAALVYHFAIHQRAISASTIAARLSAAVSIMLWTSVFLAGMSIELLG